MKNSESTSEESDVFSGDGAPGLWQQAFCAALAGGFDDPASCADACLKEFNERFGKP